MAFHFFQYIVPIIYKDCSCQSDMPPPTKISNYTSRAVPISTKSQHHFSIMYGMDVLHQVKPLQGFIYDVFIVPRNDDNSYSVLPKKVKVAPKQCHTFCTAKYGGEGIKMGPAVYSET